MKRAELAALSRDCARNAAWRLLSDEVFSDYAMGPDPERAASLVGRGRSASTFSMSGLSKIAGLPQMKLGWIVAGGPTDRARAALERLEWIADTYLSVGTPVQCAAARLLDAGEEAQRQIRERTAANLCYARDSAGRVRGGDSGGGRRLVHHGAGAAGAQRGRVGAGAVGREDVLVQPGFFYDFESEAFLVVSLLTAPEAFQEGVARLRKMADG